MSISSGVIRTGYDHRGTREPPTAPFAMRPMKRDLDQLARKEYDVLIVGGGIYGAALARETALSGLAVAVVDKEDFCGATSANSLKIIHGGVRYLQQFDLPRLRQSVRERRILMQIAPHLVHRL